MSPLMFLLFAVVTLLGVPFMLGLWTTMQRVFHFLKGRGTSGQTAFIVTLCLTAAVVTLMTSPAWVIGKTGYLLSVGAYVLFVGLGAKSTWRLKEFLRRELNSDPNDDVKIDGLRKPDDKE